VVETPGIQTASALAALAAGATAGALAERRLIGDRVLADTPLMQELGSLRGEIVEAKTNDDTTLHIEIDTPPDFDPNTTPTIVFSHGYALNLDNWHFQRKALRPFARLVFWDQRAHGRSQRGPSGSHHIDQLGFDLRAVIDTAAPSGPLLLVGHSMGGMTVMSYAAHHGEQFSERVIGTALLATSSGSIAEAQLGLPAPIAKIAHRLAPILAPTLIRQSALIEASRQRVSDLSRILTQRYSFGSEVPPEVAQFTFDMINQTPVDVVGEFLPTFDAHDKRDALATLMGREVLVMVGRSDKMTPPDHSFEIVRRVPHAELVVLSSTGHMLMLERPVEVNRELLELLDRSRRAIGVG
jgi:pimeloyl-ACP methyl ester carboxylesterase